MVKNKFQAGFTLFEMLISAGIIVLISGVVLFNHSKFDSDIEITNLAYRLAIAVREAQINSISVKQFGGTSFEVPYGLHFSRSVDNAYILYADSDVDSNGLGIYDSTTPDDMFCNPAVGSECLEKVSIGRGNKIKGWCGILNNTTQCFYTGPDSDADYEFLDIKFRRPNPDALFSVFENDYDIDDIDDNACVDGSPQACSGWAVCLISPHGREKRVVVYDTGQISVENVEPDSVCSTNP